MFVVSYREAGRDQPDRGEATGKGEVEGGQSCLRQSLFERCQKRARYSDHPLLYEPCFYADLGRLPWGLHLCDLAVRNVGLKMTY